MSGGDLVFRSPEDHPIRPALFQRRFWEHTFRPFRQALANTVETWAETHGIHCPQPTIEIESQLRHRTLTIPCGCLGWCDIVGGRIEAASPFVGVIPLQIAHARVRAPEASPVGERSVPTIMAEERIGCEAGCDRHSEGVGFRHPACSTSSEATR